ncbi:MAG: hypothetical protein ABH880_03055 [Patescibacteria group bacterium]
MPDKRKQKKKTLTAAEKKKATIDRRMKKQKELILEEIEKSPFVHVVATKAKVGRTTVYRWIKEDPEFARQFSEHRLIGDALLGEIAESQLFKAIRDGELRAITFFLKYRNPKYRTTVSIADPAKPGLSEEQKKRIFEGIERFKHRKDMPPVKVEEQ